MSVQTENFNIVIDQFTGWKTDRDSDDIGGSQSPDLLNTRFNGSHVRGALGYSLIGTRSSTAGKTTSKFTYNRIDGKQRMVRVRDDTSNGTLEWWDVTNKEWYILLGSLTTGKVMGFAEFNTSTTNNLIFCNGVENLATWTGAITRLTSAVSNGDTTINVSDTSDFPSSGTIIYNGTEAHYDSKTSTTFVVSDTMTETTIAFVDSNPDTITDSGNGFVTAGFQAGDRIKVSGSTSNDGQYTIASVVAGTITLVAGDSLTAESAGDSVTIEKVFHASSGADDGVAQAVDDATHSSITKGNILLSAKDRLWIAGQPGAPSALDYSDEGDFSTFTGGSNRSDSGTEDFFNIGGQITGLSEKGDEIVVLGEDGGDGFSFSYPTATTKAPNFREIFRSPGRGCTFQKSVFKVNNEVYFTNRNGIVAISDLEGTEKVFTKSITRDILPTLRGYDFSEAATIFHDKEDIILVSCKSDKNFPGNDTVIGVEFYIDKQGNERFGLTRIDWPVADWAILNDSDGFPELFFGSSLEMNSFKGFDSNQNDGAPRNIRYATKRYNLGDPFQNKASRLGAVRGFIKPGTDIDVEILYNSGFKGTGNKTIESTGSYVSQRNLNSIGAFAIGTNPIGATLEEISDMKEFTVYLDLGVDYEWRDLQFIFSSESNGGNFIITHVGLAADESGFASEDQLTI